MWVGRLHAHVASGRSAIASNATCIDRFFGSVFSVTFLSMLPSAFEVPSATTM